MQLRHYFIFFLAFTLVACQRVKTQNPRLSALPQDSFVQVYFNHNQIAQYQESDRQQIRPGDNLEQVIIDTITSANSTIDVAVQELHLPKIAQALVERQKAGVKVRVIVENTYNRAFRTITRQEIRKMTPRERDRFQELQQLIDHNHDGEITIDEINQGDAIAILQNGQINLLDDTADGSKGSGLMHHKFMIIDGSKVIVTSANFTTSDMHGDFRFPDSRGNPNNLLKIDSTEVARLFTQEFNLMWGDGPGGKLDSKFGSKKPFRSAQQVQLGDNHLTIQFSPTSQKIPWNQTSNGIIGKTLSTATKKIDLALFVFSEQNLVNILATKHQQNVQIRALIDRNFIYRPYSEALDMMGVKLSAKCKSESENRPWLNPLQTVGTPRLPQGDLLHHKFAIVDDKIAIAGSHNWSAVANANNDETVVIIDNPMVTAHFIREFERLYVQAELGLPRHIHQKITANSKKCPDPI